MTDKLYHYGHVVAEIGNETEQACTNRLVTTIKSLKDVFDVARVPHMVAMDKIGEVTVSVFAEQGADLARLHSDISAIPSVIYCDTDSNNDLVRAPKDAAPIPCGQPGHQCQCGIPKP
ncbi:MAG: hypothetical protein JWO78_1851 [Micavibrio sp.]|nr:hypothetical protein [Micavibrio sp.]